MDVRNRMADVTALRCKMCQGFLKLILKDGWQNELYQKAEKEIKGQTRFKDKYIPVYENMRDKGIENFYVDDMDITIINELVNAGNAGSFSAIKRCQKPTQTALKSLTSDRNLSNHLNENEDPEELYLHGLISLINLRDFVRTVDKTETDIDNEKRLAFRQEYMPAIEQLKNLLDSERIELVQQEKAMRNDIQKILDSNNPMEMWANIAGLYLERTISVDKGSDIYYKFAVLASDAGLKYAYESAAYYYIWFTKDYKEFERRLFILFNEPEMTMNNKAYALTKLINQYIRLGNTPTNGMIQILDEIDKGGYPVTLMEDGRYSLPDQYYNTKTKKIEFIPVTGGTAWRDLPKV